MKENKIKTINYVYIVNEMTNDMLSTIEKLKSTNESQVI